MAQVLICPWGLASVQPLLVKPSHSPHPWVWSFLVAGDLCWSNHFLRMDQGCTYLGQVESWLPPLRKFPGQQREGTHPDSIFCGPGSSGA